MRKYFTVNLKNKIITKKISESNNCKIVSFVIYLEDICLSYSFIYYI